jgi:osmoprotectant transport system ATP-binding protein
MIELKNLTKTFGKTTAVKDLSLTIEEGTITMLLGPSGCGKTTTLKTINRLIDINKGDILINGTSIYDRPAVALRREMGYVIQEVGIFPHLSVYDNIAIIPKILKWDENYIKNRVHELLEMVTLDSSYAQKYPLQLSGGERQRVGLARALATDPEILLMDEPFGAIDPINRVRLQDMFIDVQEEIKKTIVFVTHDINEAIKVGDKIAIMKDGELIQYDSVANILANPENEFVEQLLGSDRNIKALAIKQTKNYVRKENGYMTVTNQNKEEIEKEMRERNKKVALLLDENNKIKGRYIIEKDKKTNKKKIVFQDKIVTIKRTSNLTDTFSTLLAEGEQELPVVNRRGGFEGIINLDDILQELKKMEE